MKIEITIEATTLEDAVLAIEEAARRISTGSLTGFDENEDGGFWFEHTED